jgi:hypothetical protein
VDWLRNAALAAALLLPAIAAFHSIVLAALHNDSKGGLVLYGILIDKVADAVDLDIYGAFQMCSIGFVNASDLPHSSFGTSIDVSTTQHSFGIIYGPN